MAEFKKENRFLVLKWDDIRKYLNEDDQRKLSFLTETIYLGRRLENKKAENSYVVVNEDEPYAEQVWNLIKSHELAKEV